MRDCARDMPLICMDPPSQGFEHFRCVHRRCVALTLTVDDRVVAEWTGFSRLTDGSFPSVGPGLFAVFAKAWFEGCLFRTRGDELHPRVLSDCPRRSQHVRPQLPPALS